MLILWRYVLAVAAFFGAANVYMSRVDLSMAIVEMVHTDQSQGVKDEGSTIHRHRGSECKPEAELLEVLISEGMNSTLSQVHSTIRNHSVEFNWNHKERGFLLGSYYYGYVISQIPCACIFRRYGLRKSFGLCLLAGSLLSLLFPTLVRINLYLGITARALLGACHGVAFPAIVGAWVAWGPPAERTRLFGICVAGSSAGTVAIFLLAGPIIQALGWQAVFYITGGSTILWVSLWMVLVRDTPDKHPWISEQERDYIKSEILRKSHIACESRRNTPWKAILCSVPVWGIILGHTAFTWGNYNLNQQLPTYLTDVLGLDLKLTGLLTSICYLIQWFLCILASWITDWMRGTGLCSTLTIRKLNTVVGLWLAGLCMVAASLAACHINLAILLFVLATGLIMFNVSGSKASVLDIAAEHSGSVFAISNTIANMPGFIAPQIVGSILHSSSLTEWRYVFILSFGVQFVGSLTFLLAGSDQVQDWARHENEEGNENDVVENEMEIENRASSVETPSDSS